MAINHSMKKILKALSFDGIEVEAARHLASLKAIDPMKIFHKTIDYKIYNGDYEVPVRIYLPREKVTEDLPVFLFFHGGGWVTDCIDNYERICARLASATEHIVVSVEYRLAPEHPFPTGFMDCYAVAKAIYTNRFILNVNPQRITLIGDSAGGNLVAAVSLKARDDGIFKPQRHFSPLMETDYRNQPDTLILTAEFDPLRDEGEEYGKRLKEAGNYVEVHRIKDALHGYFALGIRYFHVQESFELINQFLSRRE